MTNNFEINPLDINIAKIQFNLINKIKNDDIISDIVEVFESKDPRLDLSEIKVICTKDFILKAEFLYKNISAKSVNLFSGTKEQLLTYLSGKDFFDTCKNCAKAIQS